MFIDSRFSSEQPEIVEEPQSSSSALSDSLLCVFCGAPYSEDMLREYHSTCGEGTCDYEHIVIYCRSCKRAVYTKGLYAPVEPHEKDQITQEDVEQWLKSLGEDLDYTAEWGPASWQNDDE